MKTKQIISLLVIASSALASAGFGQSLNYSGPLGGAHFQVAIVDSNLAVYQWFDLTLASAAGQVVADPSALTLRFADFRYQIQASTISKSVNYTTGFGTSNNYDITLTFNDASGRFVDSGLHKLAPTTGGAYRVSDTGFTPSACQLEFSGTYTIAGPIHTVTGSFDIPLNYEYVSGFSTLNTAPYPDALTFPATLSTTINTSVVNNTLFDVNVDGVQLNWVLPQAQLFSTAASTFTPGAIPEPSTWSALAGLGAIGFAVWSRRVRWSPSIGQRIEEIKLG